MASTVKEVATDLSPYIIVYTDGTVDRIFGSPTVSPSPEDPDTGVATKDTTISSAISARLYLPKNTNPTKKLPILVYYHAGFFCLESAFSSLHYRYLNLIAAASGALVVSIEYRLAPEHLLPAAYDDSWDALKWVCSHAAAHHTHFKKEEWISSHGDFSRVFIGGDSAGGNITHNLALRVGSESLPGNVKIVGVILSHPYLWGSTPTGDKDDDERMLTKMWLFAYPSAAGGIDNPMINPFVDGAPSLSGLGGSKILVLSAENDPVAAWGKNYLETVKKSEWKGEIERVEYEGEGHCFQIYDPETDKANNLIQRIAAFISLPHLPPIPIIKQAANPIFANNPIEIIEVPPAHVHLKGSPIKH